MMAQLFYRSLYLEFFERYPKNTTNFYALSGYIGPDPVSKLKDLPFNSQIIYGLQRETKNPVLHEQLKKIHNDKVSILYSEIPSHAKCYLWASESTPLRALVGSANFSLNGLNNDFRETLLEVEKPDLHAVWAYIKLIEETSKKCIDIKEILQPSVQIASSDSVCEMILYDPDDGQVQTRSALNWGFADAHVNKNDAYIPIRTSHIRQFPFLFKHIIFNPDEGHRSRAKKEHEIVELIWDDGLIMEVMFEGSQPINGINYPKQIASHPNKSILGEYIRLRLDLAPVSNEKNPNERITRDHLERYGRNSIGLSLIQPGVYSADFSPKHILR